MIFHDTDIEGVKIIDLEVRQDDRGFFARSFCREEFIAAGIEPHVEQGNLSFNYRAGTLRGMHLQVAPHPETKLIRCTRGSIVDTIVDLRWDSPTRFKHVSVELSADNRRALFVPAYFAHGYQTLEDNTEVTYLVSGAYAPGFELGLRHDDESLGLEWPLPVADISEKDAAWPLLSSWSDEKLRAVSGANE